MTTATGPSRPEPDLHENLQTGDEVAQQLSEHWRRYAGVRAQLDDLRSTRDALRRLAGGVSAATDASEGITATLSSLIGDSGTTEAWGATVLALASDAVGEILLNTAMHSGATSTTAGMKRHASWLLVSLSDNGNGGASFTPDGELSRLRTRIRDAGGMLSLDSEGGTGTAVTFALPLVPPESMEPQPASR